MSVIVPLRKWRSADPAILIGRRCIARTDQDVVIDGRLELIRWPDGTATLRFQGIGNDIIDRDYPDDSLCPNHLHLSCRECRKWDVGPLHRLEYEGWQINSIDHSDSLCPECAKTKKETK